MKQLTGNTYINNPGYPLQYSCLKFTRRLRDASIKMMRSYNAKTKVNLTINMPQLFECYSVLYNI